MAINNWDELAKSLGMPYKGGAASTAVSESQGAVAGASKATTEEMIVKAAEQIRELQQAQKMKKLQQAEEALKRWPDLSPKAISNPWSDIPPGWLVNQKATCLDCGCTSSEVHHKDCKFQTNASYDPHYLEAEAAPAAPATYRCTSCNFSKLTQEDLNVNPATGNIWGCHKCGGKKLVKND